MKHQSKYYVTKVSERALALIITDSAFQRLNDYATENQRVALLAEREAKRIAALKEATYNMSKSWEDTAHVCIFFFFNLISFLTMHL